MNKSYRNKKLLALAKHYPCQYCSTDNGTIVAAHYSGMWSNKVGKGKGLKPHDAAIAYLCMDCHDIVDNRNNVYSEHEALAVWAIACANTYRSLLESGDICLKMA